MPVVTDEKFNDLVARAIERLPERFRSALELVRIEVRDRPTRRQLRSVGLADEELLLGLYEGVPLTERSLNDNGRLPDVIYLFKEDIEDATDTAEQLTNEVCITLLHELGHYFGLDEEQLDHLGYG